MSTTHSFNISRPIVHSKLSTRRIQNLYGLSILQINQQITRNESNDVFIPVMQRRHLRQNVNTYLSRGQTIKVYTASISYVFLLSHNPYLIHMIQRFS